MDYRDRLYDVNEIKAAASSQWPEILSTVGGIPIEILDGRHHPCPNCGGTDRFRMIDAYAGALFCNQCFFKDNGDGIAAIKWLLEVDFKTSLKLIADHLGY